jgi:NTP pyrophosphatase (non-canonical NTP hydrolase)
MEIEKMIDDTRHFTKSVQDQLGPQIFSGPQTLMAELCRVSGCLAEGILVTEGKRPARSGTTVRLAHDIGDVLFIAIAISDYYHIDLEQAWNDLIQEGWGNLARLRNAENS